MTTLTTQHCSFFFLGFIGGAVVGFNLFRSFDFFNLLKRGAYGDHTIFLNTFNEFLLGIPIGGTIGVGLAFVLYKKNAKLFHLAIALGLGILLTSLLSETLDRQLRPPLVRATQHNNLAYIKGAVRRGNDLNVRDINGNTALMEGIIKGNFPLVKALIQAGADVNVVNNRGKTALMYAVGANGFKVDSNFNRDVIKNLIKAGADVNITPPRGDTVLIQELQLSEPDLNIVKAFVQAGVDVNAVNDEGQTALKLAESKNRADIVHLLREAGAKR